MEIRQTAAMGGLKRLHDDLLSVFASSAETEIGFLLLVDWLGKYLAHISQINPVGCAVTRKPDTRYSRISEPNGYPKC